MFEILTSIINFWSILISLIGLFFSFVFVLNFSSFSLIHSCENFVFNRYSAITRRVHLPKHRTPSQFTPSICFMGGGQLWMFAIGVGNYVYKNYNIDSIKFLASSSGCFAAVPLACGLDPYDWCKRDWSKCIQHFEERGLLGCLYDTKHFYYNLWDDYLPEDAHIRCSGRLYISLTLFPSMKNRVVSQFRNREELIWAIVGSICLPVVFIRDFPVKCNDELGYVLDGGFSNDSPCLDSYTITVSALHKKADIKPEMNPPRSSGSGDYYNNHHQTPSSTSTTATNAANPTTTNSNTNSSTATTTTTTNNNNSTNATPAKRNPLSTLSSSGSLSAAVGHTHSTLESLSLSARKVYNTRAAARLAALADERESFDYESSSSFSESDSGGNLLVDAASEAEALVASHKGQAGAAAEAAALKFSNRIRPIDIIRVPLYERVWEVGAMGQESAAKCLDFERHEWSSIKLKK